MAPNRDNLKLTLIFIAKGYEIPLASKNHGKGELDKISTGGCHAFRSIQEIPDIQIDACCDENSQYSSNEILYNEHPQIR